MSFKDFFKKSKADSSLSRYSVSELESLKAIYEKQLEELDSPMCFDVSDVAISSDFCISNFDGNAHIKNQIKRDLSEVIAELHKRKSESGKEREA